MSTEKLIRDKVPSLLDSDHGKCLRRASSPQEYKNFLTLKLREECHEYCDSGDLSELADILEVLLALAAYHRLSREDLEKMRLDKRQKRGAFAEGWIIETGEKNR